MTKCNQNKIFGKNVYGELLYKSKFTFLDKFWLSKGTTWYDGTSQYEYGKGYDRTSQYEYGKVWNI